VDTLLLACLNLASHDCCFPRLFIYPRAFSKSVGHQILATARSRTFMSSLRCLDYIAFGNLASLDLFFPLYPMSLMFCYNIVLWLGALFCTTSEVVARYSGCFLMFVGRWEGCSKRMDALTWRCRIPSIGHHFGYHELLARLHTLCHKNFLLTTTSTDSYFYGHSVAAGALCIRIFYSSLSVSLQLSDGYLSRKNMVLLVAGLQGVDIYGLYSIFR